MKSPMKLPALATVFLDDAQVGLMGDPMPRVAKIVAATGREPQAVQVLRMKGPDDKQGTPMSLDDEIDRTAEPTVPIYLVSKARVRPVPTEA
jgi:hypothetical protein